MNLEVFKNEEFGEIKVVKEDGGAWFIAKDICDILELGNPSQSLSRLDDDEKNTIILNEGIGNPEKLVVNEMGLYALILGSRKKEAKQFKRWITHEVLPSIRKTGGYVSNDQLFINTYLPFADEQTKQLFSTTLELVKSQNRLIGEMKPKVEYFDKLVDRHLLTNFRDTAKELHISPSNFIKNLENGGYVYRDRKHKLKPYQVHVEKGLFELKEFINSNNGHADTQTLITPRGRETFKLLFN